MEMNFFIFFHFYNMETTCMYEKLLKYGWTWGYWKLLIELGNYNNNNFNINVCMWNKYLPL